MKLTLALLGLLALVALATALPKSKHHPTAHSKVKVSQDIDEVEGDLEEGRSIHKKHGTGSKKATARRNGATAKQQLHSAKIEDEAADEIWADDDEANQQQDVKPMKKSEPVKMPRAYKHASEKKRAAATVSNHKKTHKKITNEEEEEDAAVKDEEANASSSGIKRYGEERFSIDNGDDDDNAVDEDSPRTDAKKKTVVKKMKKATSKEDDNGNVLTKAYNMVFGSDKTGAGSHEDAPEDEDEGGDDAKSSTLTDNSAKNKEKEGKEPDKNNKKEEEETGMVDKAIKAVKSALNLEEEEGSEDGLPIDGDDEDEI